MNDLYQALVQQFNQDHLKHQLKMPPQSFFVARGRPRTQTKSSKEKFVGFFSDICRKEVDHVWIVPRYCDDDGKSDEQIIKVRKRVQYLCSVAILVGSLRLLCLRKC